MAFRALVGVLEPLLFPRRYFERIYRRSADPWRCSTSDYEQLKFQHTLAAVSQRVPSGRILEVGCGEGIFTELLAATGRPILAIDISAIAIDRARARCSWSQRVEFQHIDVTAEPVRAKFELIVLAEVLYYLGRGRRFRTACDVLVELLHEEGRLVVVNPWPAALKIERRLREHPALVQDQRAVHPDPGRSYSVTVYRRVSSA